VTYRDISELLAAEARIATMLAGSSDVRRRSKQTMLVASKGLC